MADETDTVAAPEVDAQAREMGWRPKEEFKGEEGKWVDAKTYLDRGEHVLPIVKETNKRLRADVQTMHGKVAELEQALRASQETITALDKYHKEDLQQKVKKAREDIKAQLVAAKKSGDVEAEVDLTEQLGTLTAAEDTTTVTTTTPARREAPKDFTKDPIFVTWKEDNPWFGSDKSRTAIAYQMTTELRAEGDTSVGRAFLDKVTDAVNKEVARLGGRSSSGKVEAGKGGAGGNSGGNGAGKTYADLPAEAKAACDSFGADLVGANRKYATTDEWRKSYVTQYFAEV